MICVKNTAQPAKRNEFTKIGNKARDIAGGSLKQYRTRGQSWENTDRINNQ